MKLEFSDVLSPNLKKEIKTVEKTLDSAFKKKSTFREKIINKSITYFLCIALFTISSMSILALTNISLFGILSLAGILGVMIFMLLLIDCAENYCEEKNKVSLINKTTFDYYQKKEKNINGEKINKKLKKLTPKQKEILKLIQEKGAFKKPINKTAQMLIKEKIENTSQLEFDLNRKVVMDYVNNIENKKQKNKFITMLNDNFKMTKPKVIEKQIKKEVVVLENS